MKTANLQKTIYYLRRNGVRRTFYAVRERLASSGQPAYRWNPPAGEELEEQRKRADEFRVTFSIVTPTYRTPEKYLREMIDSVRSQSYEKWELILADATEDNSVKAAVDSYEDSRIRYLRLEKNAGIAENTNPAIAAAGGDYVGLLDHDDVLTQDALFEMAAAIERERENGRCPVMLYSDEDKCNGEMTEFYDPNRKEDFNFDLLLSNNYICHFLVMERQTMQSLGLRKEYDGAQDYDLVLRAAGRIRRGEGDLKTREQKILHIPRVLYHWRCHSSSTAENPGSKLYAYEAGRRALQDFADVQGWNAEAVNTEHVGFYRLKYRDSPFESREDLGAVGGRILHRRRVAGGRMTEAGEVYYQGLSEFYSGYLHRAALSQDAEVLDVRNIQVAERLRDVFALAAGVPYRELPGRNIFDASSLGEDADFVQISIRVSRALRQAGYRLLYLPEREVRV